MESVVLSPCENYTEGECRKALEAALAPIDGLGWDIAGDFTSHEYEITQDGRPIVYISKEWMTWGDSYLLDIQNPADEIVALAVVITIDCVVEQQNN